MDRAHKAQHAAAGYWAISPDTVLVTELTQPKFPWATKHAFFILKNRKLQPLLVVVDEKDVPIVFEALADATTPGSADNNQKNANQLFIDEKVVLPLGLDLPWTARTMLAGLGGWVASRAFWNQEKDAMSMWATNRPHDGPRLFEDQCGGPLLTHDGHGLWSYHYRYFNRNGGVESWKLEGDAREIRYAEMEMVLPNGTWFVPYA
jgi:hypothetical protein